MEELLVVSHLKKTFRLSRKQQKIAKTREATKVAVNDLSFTVRSGEVYGLLGPNGAGKTTTLRIISTLIKADEGDVFVDGSSVKKDAEEVRKKIGFLTSELKLEDFLPRTISSITSPAFIIFPTKKERSERNISSKNSESISFRKSGSAIFRPE